MKAFLITIATILLSIFLTIQNQDYRNCKRHYIDLKQVCVEASASGAIFYDEYQYSQGKFIFNRIEAVKAIEDQIKTVLYLDDSFNPLPESYWTEHVTYDVYFFDDSNTNFNNPVLFTHNNSLFTQTITKPTLIVCINAGKGRFRSTLLSNDTDIIRVAAHEIEGRNS